jgi:hypothetical protein
MTPDHWILAVVVLGAGLLLGELGGRLVRATMGRADRSAEIREMARPMGTFVFWAGTSLGLLVAVATLSPTTLRELPERSLVHLPNLLVAGLLLIAGYAVAIGVSAAVGQSATRATGVRHRALERLLRVAIMSAALVVALGQLGVDTTLLMAVVVVLLGAPALAAALLTALGGREVAANLAAGRALRGRLGVDQRIVIRSSNGQTIEGTVLSVHPVGVELLTDDLRRVQVPHRHLLDATLEIGDFSRLS